MPHATSNLPEASLPPPRRGWPVTLVVAGAVVTSIVAFASVGSDRMASQGQGAAPVVAAAASALLTLVQASITPLLWILAACGYGAALTRLLTLGDSSRSGSRGAHENYPGFSFQAALGVGVLLWLAQLIGMLGGFSSGSASSIAWGIVIGGIALLTWRIAAADLHPEHWPAPSWWAILGAIPAGIALVAAASPPGALWDSEFAGYDTLSYHLQLVKEWALPAPFGVGALAPVEHNVYSYLPSHVEAGYLQLAAMDFMGQSPLAGHAAMFAPLTGESTWLQSCSLLHAGMGVLTAMCVGRCVLLISGSGRAGLLAAIAFLATPWTQVVGSMAYNELGVTLGLAGAMLACVEPGLRAPVRGLAAGLLIGAACNAKPTALVLAGPVAGILLLTMVSGARSRVLAVIFGTLGGVAMLLPWLIRNALDCGNPVFPFATGLFGSGEWDAEQVSRYSGAHTFDGGIIKALVMLVSDVRGFRHAQWSVMPLLGATGLVLGACRWRTHRTLSRLSVLLLVALFLQILAWSLFTHIQSRFLIPLGVTLSIGFGLGIASIAARQLAASLVGATAILVLSVWSSVNFASQRGGNPNHFLTVGLGGMTGLAYQPMIDPRNAAPDERDALVRSLPPAMLVNLLIDDLSPVPGARLLMIGDATPLYWLDATGGDESRVVYHTTWDRGPLARAIAVAPDDPPAWSTALAERGFTLLLVNFDELERLSTRDKWYDPLVTIPLIEAMLAAPHPDGRVWVIAHRWDSAGRQIPPIPGDTRGGTVLYRLDRPPSPGRGGSQ